MKQYGDFFKNVFFLALCLVVIFLHIYASEVSEKDNCTKCTEMADHRYTDSEETDGHFPMRDRTMYFSVKGEERDGYNRGREQKTVPLYKVKAKKEKVPADRIGRRQEKNKKGNRIIIKELKEIFFLFKEKLKIVLCFILKLKKVIITGRI